jgi:hypothetical protein
MMLLLSATSPLAAQNANHTGAPFDGDPLEAPSLGVLPVARTVELFIENCLHAEIPVEDVAGSAIGSVGLAGGLQLNLSIIGQGIDTRRLLHDAVKGVLQLKEPERGHLFFRLSYIAPRCGLETELASATSGNHASVTPDP